MNNLDPKLQQVLKQIEPFGFKFFGFDENKRPLVLGPNNQVTEINIAIGFVNDQIKRQAQSSSSPENFEVPQTPDSNSTIERSTEVQLENSLESQKESQDNDNNQNQVQVNQNNLTVQKKAPEIKMSQLTEKPYGDGFDPKTFSPTDIESALKFVEKNSKASKTSSNKWLATRFQWFLKNYGSTFK